MLKCFDKIQDERWVWLIFVLHSDPWKLMTFMLNVENRKLKIRMSIFQFLTFDVFDKKIWKLKKLITFALDVKNDRKIDN